MLKRRTRLTHEVSSERWAKVKVREMRLPSQEITSKFSEIEEKICDLEKMLDEKLKEFDMKSECLNARDSVDGNLLKDLGAKVSTQEENLTRVAEHFEKYCSVFVQKLGHVEAFSKQLEESLNEPTDKLLKKVFEITDARLEMMRADFMGSCYEWLRENSLLKDNGHGRSKRRHCNNGV
jgi:flagellar biosynthesis chaperone FliJ